MPGLLHLRGVLVLRLWRISGNESISQEKKEAIREILLNKAGNGRNLSLDLDMASFGDKNETALRRAAESIAKLSDGARSRSAHGTPSNGLPRRISFPYSRHSSYPELCEFVDAFNPRDVWPCTVDPVAWMNEGTALRLPRHSKVVALTSLKGRASGPSLASIAPAIHSNTMSKWRLWKLR